MRRAGLFADTGDDMSDPKLKKYMDPVIKEAIMELALVESAFDSLIDHIEFAKVQDIQYHLKLITGAMVMLSLGRAANILNSCSHYISRLSSTDEAGDINRQGAQLFMGIIDDLTRYLGSFPEDGDYQETLLIAMEDKSTQLKQLSSVKVIKDVIPVRQTFQRGATVNHNAPEVSINEPLDEIATIPLQGREKINIELKRNFLQTARKNIKAGSMVLSMLSKSPESTVLVNEFRKILHALKDSALAAGISEVVELCHSMELLVTMLIRRDDQHVEEINELLTQSYEQLTTIVEQFNHQETMNPVEELVLRINKRLTGSFKGSEKGGNPSETHLRHNGAARALRRRTHRNHAASPGKHGRSPAGSPDNAESGQVDIHLEVLGDTQSAVEESYTILRSYLDEMQQEMVKLRDCLSHDMTALSPSAETRNDNGDNPDNSNVLTGYLDESDKLHDQSKQLMNMVGQCLIQQQQILASLKARLRQTRIVAVTSQIVQFNKVVERVSREHAKKVRLNLVGGHVKLDQALLNRLIEPLKYLIAYCIEHTIEEPERRLDSGKPESATLTIEFVKENSDLVIKVHDDGAGIGLDQLHNVAVNLGHAESEDVLTDTEISALVFNQDFNKKSNIPWLMTQNIPLSDVAYSVKSIGGSIVLTSIKDFGSTFIIRLPCELDTSQVLMVQVDKEIYAIPTASIEDVVYLDGQEAEALISGDDCLYQYNGHDYHFRNLGVVLGKTQTVQPEEDRQYPIVLISLGNKRIALQVDQIKGQREIIINQPVPELNRVKVISGATLLSDGRMVLVLELGALLGEDVGNLKAINQLSTV